MGDGSVFPTRAAHQSRRPSSKSWPRSLSAASVTAASGYTLIA